MEMHSELQFSLNVLHTTAVNYIKYHIYITFKVSLLLKVPDVFKFESQ